MKNYMFCFVLIVAGCANIVPPSGGGADVNPPKLISSNPPNKTTEFSSSSVLLQFDEYIQLKNKNAIQISPPCEPTPKIIVRGKRVEFDFSCSLDTNITYTINFGNSICDLNEGNVLENFTYVFSTGKVLDSININGSAKHSYSYESIGGAMIGLYKSFDFSRPYYYTYTNAEGDFSIENIKDGEYVIFGFSDNNQNLNYDHGEAVTIPEKLNPLEGNKNLKFFYEESESKKISVSNTSSNSLLFENKLISDSIVILNSSGFWNHDNGSSEFWFNTSPELIEYLINGVTDSIQLYNKLAPKISLNVANNIEDIIKDKSVLIKSNNPIKECNSNSFYWSNGRQAIEPKIINYFTIEVPIEDKNLKEEKLIIYPGGISFETDLKNDSTSFLLDFDPVNYGTLNIKCINFKNNMILEIYDDTDIIKKHKLNQELIIKYINPGNYKLRVFEDLNNDYHWNPGVVEKRESGEFVYIYSDVLKIKPNWELDVHLDLEK